MGAKLPGEPSLPPAAAALPKDNMIPLGIRYETKDVLGVDGAGPGAFGYYKEVDKRYRVVARRARRRRPGQGRGVDAGEAAGRGQGEGHRRRLGAPA